MLIFSTGCNKVDNDDSNLFSDNGYIDYAEKVFFDLEKYPDMADMGLFWTKWDESTQSIVMIPADSEEGADLIDVNKPTLINVHGVLMEGYKSQEKFYLNKKVARPREFDLETDDVSMTYLWLREGWNVGYFHYNRFVAEFSPNIIEHKIWSAKSKHGMFYRHANGQKSDNDVSEYCLAEHFAADYIRAMRLLPEEMGKEEIRIAAHSMGGQLSTATLLLLTELTKHGQLPKSQLPSRFALLDAYFGTTLTLANKDVYIGPEDAIINWSNKPLIDNHAGKTMIECLKYISARDIAIEYYTFPNIISSIMRDLTPQLMKYSSYAMLIPDFEGGTYTMLTDGHNGVREWYLCSLLDAPLKDITDTETDNFAPSASLPTDELWKLKNTQFVQVSGQKTVRTRDDAMAKMYNIFYYADGGTLDTKSQDFFSRFSPDVPLLPPTKRGYTFKGWYDNVECTGEAINHIDTSATKKDIHLYAKWE